MSCKVIELNDRAISVGDERGVYFRSPGFVLADGSEILLGETAEQRARLMPTKSYNKYWHELNLEPISHGNNFRHHADIAFAHLQHVAEAADLDSDVIVAVPGSFSRQQLSIFLGLVQHSPFNVKGVVDSALAASLAAARAQNILYVDMQLHQIVITRLNVDSSHVQSESSIQIPGVGSQDLIEGMMQIATGRFIQQCRFNPQHNAESEQQLYNELPSWLANADDGNLIMELNAGDLVHTAKMPLGNLVENLNGDYKRIISQINAMTEGHGTQLLMSQSLAELPGFKDCLPSSLDIVIVEQDALIDACLEHQEQIISDASGIALRNRLPVSSANSIATNTLPDFSAPTHLLHNHRALPLQQVRIENHQTLNGNASLPNVLALSIAELPKKLGAFSQRAEEVFFDSGKLTYLHNGTSTTGECKVALGDTIQFQGSQDVLKFIKVQDV